MGTNGATKRGLGMPLELEDCHALIRELIELVEKQDADIGYLEQRLHNLLREKYGRSSEKLSSGQLQLFAQELEEMLERKKSPTFLCGRYASNASPKAKNEWYARIASRTKTAPVALIVQRHHHSFRNASPVPQ